MSLTKERKLTDQRSCQRGIRSPSLFLLRPGVSAKGKNTHSEPKIHARANARESRKAHHARGRGIQAAPTRQKPRTPPRHRTVFVSRVSAPSRSPLPSKWRSPLGSSGYIDIHELRRKNVHAIERISSVYVHGMCSRTVLSENGPDNVGVHGVRGRDVYQRGIGAMSCASCDAVTLRRVPQYARSAGRERTDTSSRAQIR